MSNRSTHEGTRHPVWVQVALWQGVLAPLLLALVAIGGGALQPGYSHVSQAISELTAAGEPDKVFLDPALLLMQIMSIAFGIGFFRVVRRLNTPLKISAALMVLIGLVGVFFYPFPMDQVGSEITFDGVMHMVIVSVSAIAAIAAVTCAATGWGRIPRARWLAILSWTLLAAMLVTGLAAIPTGLFGWPAIGLWQRANTGAFGLWQIVTALYLLRRGRTVALP